MKILLLHHLHMPGGCCHLPPWGCSLLAWGIGQNDFCAVARPLSAFCRQDLRTRNMKREHRLDQENGFMRPRLVFASQLRRKRQNSCQPPPASPQHTLCSQLMAWKGFFLSSCHVSAAQPIAVGYSEEAFSSVSCPSASPPKTGSQHAVTHSRISHPMDTLHSLVALSLCLCSWVAADPRVSPRNV